MGTLKLLTFVGVLVNLRAIGEAIGEGAAKLLGYGKSIKALEDATKAYEEASRRNAAAKAQLAQATQLAADKSLGLTDASRKIVAEFGDVIAKGGETSTALDKVAKALDLGSLDGIRNAGAALDALGQRGKLTGDQIREALAVALKSEDLNVFRINALAAFDGTEQGARRLKAAIDSIGEEALRRAGSSLNELTSGFRKGATSAINDVDALVVALKDLNLTGEDVSRTLESSLEKALAAAGTERAIQAVIDRFVDLGKQGVLTGEQVARGLEKARSKVDDLKPGVQSLGEALRNFGLSTATQLQLTADKLSASYRQIADSATVSLGDKVKAFAQYRDAAVAANGGVESSEVALQRTMLETKAAALGMGDVFERSMQRAERATRSATAALREQAASLSSSFGDRNAEVTKGINDSKAKQDAINHAGGDNTGLASLLAKQAAGTLSEADLATAREPEFDTKRCKSLICLVHAARRATTASSFEGRWSVS